ncbi:MAG: tRNA pseudouridine(38-40) synthase TruA [Halobacteriota archaeon]|uniref:tRNA pseudouridine(38-40) synthase TruA n=1 Tax=Natronomonas sp. TaxID=2184060 RepID=UPI0039748A19
MRAFRVAYDGSDYSGFQRQPHGETVENAIFAGLRALGIEFDGGAPVDYAAAGRTDAGVSARAQTVAFDAPAWLSARAFNSELPASIRAWAAADVIGAFHATHDATERRYRYFLHASTADDELARDACRRLSGERDFHNFTPDDSGTVRDLSVSIRRDGEFLVIDCRAGGFARQLVRRLVTGIESVALELREPAFIDRALGPKPLSGPEGIAPASPEPLVLLDVSYPGVEFELDAEAHSIAREIFQRRRTRRLATARVAGSLLNDEP